MIETPSYIEQTVKLRDYSFRVRSRAVLPAISDRQNIKAAWLFISHYIKLYEVSHPPVLMDKH